MNADGATIDWFSELLEQSQGVEETDPAPVLDWLAALRKDAGMKFKAELIPLRDVDKWSADPQTGNIAHDSGEFFSITGVRVTAGELREVDGWDQPILTQESGGVLVLLCQKVDGQIRFLLQGRVAPGNIGVVQIAPTIQSTWSNLRRAHGGRRPPFAEYVLEKDRGRTVYSADHNEEGGPFWEKVNNTRIILLGDDKKPTIETPNTFTWASLSQIKALALMDNVLSPFVKAIISPL